jgi:putative membrane protein insertion efficiency factor
MIEILIKRLLQLLIKAYAYLVSPWLGNRCRFHPSCSVYASEAIEEHGIFKGFVLAMRRLLKCAPWSRGGYDPVPPKIKSDHDESL